MRLLKWVGGSLAAIALLAAAAVLVIQLRGPKVHRPDPNPIERTPERLARGEYLVRSVGACFNCHSERQDDLWSHPPKPGSEGEADCSKDPDGSVDCTRNISSSKTAGIGAWTDGEVMRAIREGISRDGTALFPMMPYEQYRSLSDEDAKSIVAYLRTLPAIEKPVSTGTPFPLSLVATLSAAPVDGPVAAPPRTDPVAYGRYLTTIAACPVCHTPVDAFMRPDETKRFAGGQVFDDVVRSANLTPDPTGLQRYSKEGFISLFKAYQGTDPSALKIEDPSRNTPMPWTQFAGMTEADLGAIYDYLRTVPPVPNRVEKFVKR